MTDENTDGSYHGEQVRVSLYVENVNGTTQIVEKGFHTSKKAFNEAQELLDDIEQEPHIDDGDFCYVQIDRYAGGSDE